MKPYSPSLILFAIILLIFICNLSNAQTIPQRKRVPIYKEIKPHKDEIVDHPAGSIVISKLNLFNHLKYLVTYILNGKKTNNANHAQYLLNRKNVKIESFHIEEPTKNEKRLIRINYKML